jgi:hypothetical protein
MPVQKARIGRSLLIARARVSNIIERERSARAVVANVASVASFVSIVSPVVPAGATSVAGAVSMASPTVHVDSDNGAVACRNVVIWDTPTDDSGQSLRENDSSRTV